MKGGSKLQKGQILSLLFPGGIGMDRESKQKELCTPFCFSSCVQLVSLLPTLTLTMPSERKMERQCL